jgi:hypothetical protein
MTTLLIVAVVLLVEATEHRTHWFSHYVMPPRREP